MPYKDKETQRRYQREWVARRRAEWLAENGPCVDCGSTDDLEVDHVDPGVKVSHRVWSWSAERRAAELAKCEVRCSPCHQRKTTAWWESQRQHGTRTMYERGGCHCDECRAAKVVHNSKRAYDPNTKRMVWVG